MARSLFPTLLSGGLCVLASVFWVSAHLLLLSVAKGTALPGFLDGQWATFYTNNVVRPLSIVLGSDALSNIVVIVAWGFVGLIVYSILEAIVTLFREERSAEQDLQFGQRILHHPMRRAFFVTLIWRIGVLLLAFAVFLLISQYPSMWLEIDAKIIAGTYDMTAGLQQLGLALLGWALIAHGVVVFLRLFLLRPRLFGDVHIEAV